MPVSPSLDDHNDHGDRSDQGNHDDQGDCGDQINHMPISYYSQSFNYPAFVWQGL